MSENSKSVASLPAELEFALMSDGRMQVSGTDEDEAWVFSPEEAVEIAKWILLTFSVTEEAN